MWFGALDRNGVECFGDQFLVRHIGAVDGDGHPGQGLLRRIAVLPAADTLPVFLKKRYSPLGSRQRVVPTVDLLPMPSRSVRIASPFSGSSRSSVPEKLTDPWAVPILNAVPGFAAGKDASHALEKRAAHDSSTLQPWPEAADTAIFTTQFCYTHLGNSEPFPSILPRFCR